MEEPKEEPTVLRFGNYDNKNQLPIYNSLGRNATKEGLFHHFAHCHLVRKQGTFQANSGQIIRRQKAYC